MIKLSSFDVELKFKFKYAHIASVIDGQTQERGVQRNTDRLLTTGEKHWFSYRDVKSRSCWELKKQEETLLFSCVLIQTVSNAVPVFELFDTSNCQWT